MCAQSELSPYYKCVLSPFISFSFSYLSGEYETWLYITKFSFLLVLNDYVISVLFCETNEWKTKLQHTTITTTTKNYHYLLTILIVQLLILFRQEKSQMELLEYLSYYYCDKDFGFFRPKFCYLLYFCIHWLIYE